MIYINQGLYAYRQRSGSITKTWTEKWMHALVDAMSERITLLANMNYPLEKHLAVYRQMLEVSLANGQASGLSASETYKEFEMKRTLLNKLSVQSAKGKESHCPRSKLCICRPSFNDYQVYLLPQSLNSFLFD